ncbi:MAG: hypothetical protein O7C67_14305 [Gammaproteobacteria bacterium]|nr:hypothetical protein [Gammaproteobacteria bacterium]
MSLLTIGGFGLVMLRERWRQVVDSRVSRVEVYHRHRMREDLHRFIAAERRRIGSVGHAGRLD